MKCFHYKQTTMHFFLALHYIETKRLLKFLKQTHFLSKTQHVGFDFPLVEVRSPCPGTSFLVSGAWLEHNEGSSLGWTRRYHQQRTMIPPLVEENLKHQPLQKAWTQFLEFQVRFSWQIRGSCFKVIIDCHCLPVSESTPHVPDMFKCQIKVFHTKTPSKKAHKHQETNYSDQHVTNISCMFKSKDVFILRFEKQGMNRLKSRQQLGTTQTLSAVLLWASDCLWIHLIYMISTSYNATYALCINTCEQHMTTDLFPWHLHTSFPQLDVFVCWVYRYNMIFAMTR